MLTDDLLELQRVDTRLDQLAHRRARLQEREAAAAAEAALREATERRAALVARDGELDTAITALEQDTERLAAQKERLEAQLKTVIAPREAEALMHELETLAQRRDALEDEELGHLEEQSSLAGELAGIDEQVPGLQSRVDEARAALAIAEAVIDEEVAALRAAREAVAERVGPGMLGRYEQLRARFGGVAVAALEGSRCGGCHLDLSTTELAEVRSVPAGELAECPQCGRLLVP